VKGSASGTVSEVSTVFSVSLLSHLREAASISYFHCQNASCESLKVKRCFYLLSIIIENCYKSISRYLVLGTRIWYLVFTAVFTVEKPFEDAVTRVGMGMGMGCQAKL